MNQVREIIITHENYVANITIAYDLNDIAEAKSLEQKACNVWNSLVSLIGQEEANKEYHDFLDEKPFDDNSIFGEQA